MKDKSTQYPVIQIGSGSVTRFAGRVIARCDYLGGTNRYLVVTQIDRKVENAWFDEGRLVAFN